MNAVFIRSLSAAAAAASLLLAPLAAHADRYADVHPLLSSSAGESPSGPSGITRAQVREEARTWKAAGMMSVGGEAGDTPEVLEARETFNALQAEVLTAEYAHAERTLQAFAAEASETSE